MRINPYPLKEGVGHLRSQKDLNAKIALQGVCGWGVFAIEQEYVVTMDAVVKTARMFPRPPPPPQINVEINIQSIL